jgi:hypothetical protein
MTLRFLRCRALEQEAQMTIRAFLRTLARLVPRQGSA